MRRVRSRSSWFQQGSPSHQEWARVLQYSIQRARRKISSEGPEEPRGRMFSWREASTSGCQKGGGQWRFWILQQEGVCCPYKGSSHRPSWEESHLSWLNSDWEVSEQTALPRGFNVEGKKDLRTWIWGDFFSQGRRKLDHAHLMMKIIQEGVS